MCGFFAIAYKDHKDDLGKVLVNAGKRLSYRGYDSVGAASFDGHGGFKLRKGVGRIEEVAEKLKFEKFKGKRGMLQLRWATFGPPCVKNAQPHTDCSNYLVGAHNGNIVNSPFLAQELKSKGHQIKGENDGEILVHEIEEFLKKEKNLKNAILSGVKELRGDYACVITARDDDKFYAVKNGASLFLGKGKDFICISSDLISILDLTRDVVMLDDGELVEFNWKEYRVSRLSDGKEKKKSFKRVDITPSNVEKGGYAHFMLKEIEESPKKAQELLHLLSWHPSVSEFSHLLSQATHPYLVGAGTSFHAGMLGAYYFNKIAGKVVLPSFAAEFVERFGVGVKREDIVIGITQSGETKDVKNVLDFCKKKRIPFYAIVNVIGSTIARKSRGFLPIACDTEISVPATKTFINQVITLLWLSIKVAKLNNKKPPLKEKTLEKIPKLLTQTINETKRKAKQFARILMEYNDLYCVGYGITYPIALEGALKVKEVTYAHCEGMYSSEFKHGPLSIVTPGYPVIFVTTEKDKDMVLSHINEVKTRGGRILTIGPQDEELKERSNFYIEIPKCNYYIFPILSVIPLQLAAYFMSVRKNLNPDFPRNLSKTLTVD